MANSVLEAFYILFKIDSQQAKKQLEQVDKALTTVERVSNSADHAVTKVGSTMTSVFGAAGGVFKSVEHSASRLNSTLVTLTGGILSIRAAFLGIKKSVSYAADLDLIAERSRVSAQELDLWGRAAKAAGGDAQAFMSDVQNLSLDLSKINAFGGSDAATGLRQIGINPRDEKGRVRDTLDLLSELSDRFQSVPQAQSLALGERLGLDSGTILLLQRGRTEVEAMIKHQRELGVVTKQDTETARKFRLEWQDTTYSLRSVGLAIGSVILPAIEWLLLGLQKLIGFFQKYPELGKGSMIALAAIITGVLLPALIRTAVASVTAFAPFYAVAAVIGAVGAAFALLYDDISVFLKGGNSLVGEFLKKFPVLAEIIKGVAATISYLAHQIAGYGEFLSQLFINPKKAFQEYVQSSIQLLNEFLSHFPQLKGAIDTVVALFKIAGGAIKMVWDSVAQSIQSVVAGITKGIDLVVAGYNKVKSAVGLGKKAQQEVIGVNSALSYASGSPFNFTPSSVITNNQKISPQVNKSNLVQIEGINIQTQATDAEGISQAIGKTLNSHMRQAINTYDDGVLS